MKRRGNPFGWLCFITGLIIILSMVLPSSFWWFAFGAALIWVGLCLLKK